MWDLLRNVNILFSFSQETYLTLDFVLYTEGTGVTSNLYYNYNRARSEKLVPVSNVL